MVNQLEKPGVAVPLVNWGRWLGPCSWRDRCDATIAVELFASGLICPDCGMGTELVWPSVEMVEGIARLLLMRPHRKNQNWTPGETLHDLLEENMIHGIIGRHAAAIKSGPIISIEGDQIAFDALPNLNPRRELVR